MLKLNFFYSKSKSKKKKLRQKKNDSVCFNVLKTEENIRQTEQYSLWETALFFVFIYHIIHLLRTPENFTVLYQTAKF